MRRHTATKCIDDLAEEPLLLDTMHSTKAQGVPPDFTNRLYQGQSEYCLLTWAALGVHRLPTASNMFVHACLYTYFEHIRLCPKAEMHFITSHAISGMEIHSIQRASGNEKVSSTTDSLAIKSAYQVLCTAIDILESDRKLDNGLFHLKHWSIPKIGCLSSCIHRITFNAAKMSQPCSAVSNDIMMYAIKGPNLHCPTRAGKDVILFLGQGTSNCVYLVCIHTVTILRQ